MDSCFNSHALRQFENDEAEKERRAIEAADSVLWMFAEDAKDPDKLARIISDFDIDVSPIISLIFKPVTYPPTFAAGRIEGLKKLVHQCFHRYIEHQIQKELEK